MNFKNLRFVGTSRDRDEKAHPHKYWKPDISTYSSDIDLGNQRDPINFFANKEKPVFSPMCNFESLLSFELEQGNHDPFLDKPNEPGAQFESAHIKTQGRIAAILDGMLSNSFRTHAFLIFMDGHIARLFRADRAGILVSEAIKYREEPKYLIEFLRRFDHTQPNERGIDTTVKHGNIMVPISSNSKEFEIVKLEGCLPHTDSESFVGRGRRTFKVLGTNPDQHFFMKDGWREDSPGMMREWEVLGDLNANQVPHIPKIIYGSDIQGDHHHTLTDQYASSEWRIGPKTELVGRVHYRFIEEDAGRPLKEFENAKELTQVLADVVEGVYFLRFGPVCIHS